MRWEVLSKRKIDSKKQLIETLLKNRGVKDKNEFFNPTLPEKISVKSLGLSPREIGKAITRIKEAKKSGEKVIVYGDYDADGICGTAILWETLYAMGLQTLPYIPERFSEGYGLNSESIKKLKKQNPELGLIITVDHGIVAGEKVDLAKSLGIDVIITDHHQVGKIKPKAFAVVHTDKISGSGVAWILSRELGGKPGLELVAIGTLADQLPLVGPNRSLVKYGLEELNKTKRNGLISLFKEAGIDEIGSYEVGFIIAPRLNAMGRLGHAIESLRLLCTKDKAKAKKLVEHLNETNVERQKIVEEVVINARSKVTDEKVIVLAHESYHEGVIGLAAARLVEEFYRPSIVISTRNKIAKASARSVSGFNIIENIRKLESLYIEGGGHPMAAGFSIEIKKIEEFTRKINKIAESQLTADLLQRKLRVDMEIEFGQMDWDLYKIIESLEPAGLGNPTPTFVSKKVEVLDVRTVGKEAKHLKLKLKQNDQLFDAIYFGGGQMYSKVTPDSKIDVVYQLADNAWNSHKSLQLKIKDLKIS